MAWNRNRVDGTEALPVRSRRGLLAGAAGVLGALAAEVVAPAQPAVATQGQNVVLGTDNTGATARTGIFTTNNTEWAQLADPGTTPALGSQGVYGVGQDVGVRGEAANGPGVIGKAGITNVGGGGNAPGVLGYGSGTGQGVFGYGGPSGGNGVEGSGSGEGAGVAGFGGLSNGAGVEGFGNGAGAGVSGTGGHGGGDGVAGTGSAGGNGVVGTGNSLGVGVLGLGDGALNWRYPAARE